MRPVKYIAGCVEVVWVYKLCTRRLPGILLAGRMMGWKRPSRFLLSSILVCVLGSLGLLREFLPVLSSLACEESSAYNV